MGSAEILLTSLVWLTLSSSTLASESRTTHHHHQHQESTDSSQGHHQDHAREENALVARLGSIPSTTWLAGFSSIAVISLVGLVTVGVIPMLKGRHQDSALQLLVSLAVGTLVGDALMHLLPHALQTGHGSTSIIWKGFTASLTIIAFFVMDRVLEGLGHSHSHSGSEAENLTVSTRTSRESSPVSKVRPGGEEEGSSRVVLQSKSVASLYSLYHREQSYQSLRPQPQSVCWMPASSMMVILGDAVHNFADGIAIGAAFSISLAAGLSTSIAVLCHELPHEVGDFALLLHSGMTVKVAVFYNLVSSVFAFLGLLVGLVLGTQGNFSSWLLSGTVGVFLYVALVSMMTELKGGHWTRSVSNTLGRMVLS